MDYRGKWVQKGETDEESGTGIIDVIEVIRDEVKAVGRNLHINELLTRYQRLEDSDIRVADPFGMPLGLPVTEYTNDEVIEEKDNDIPERNDVYIYDPKTKAINDDKQHHVFEQVSNKSPYSKEEETILNLIKTTVSNKPVKKNLSIQLSVEVDFDIDMFKAGSKMLGLSEETVNSCIAIYIRELLDDQVFLILTFAKNSLIVITINTCIC
jgi:hypothetical protein